MTENEQRTPFGDEAVSEAEARISKYEYNLSGALVKQTYPDGREVRNAFEADGDLSRIYGKANPNATERTYANSFSYTPDGRIEKLRLGNSRWEWAKFNERLQVTELNLGSGVQDASLWKLKYEYGEINSSGDVDPSKNTGNIARMTTSFSGLSNPFVQTFKYDSLYRLVEAKEKSGTNENWKELFSYDRYGNRIGNEKYLNTVQQSLDNKTHPTINPQTNRFNTNQGYTYDFNGNLISDAEGRNFTFNGDNKQSEIRNGTTLLARYFYDGEGKRIKKLVYNPTETVKEETIFVYDGSGKLIAEYSTAAPPQNPTTSYTATDMLGSPRVITDSQGNVTSRRDFMPFGEELANDPNYRTAALKYNTGDGIRQKFTGYQKDEETNLDFAEARMYENRHARFTAVDPLLASGKSANPQTFNRYVYVGNSPLTRTDPNGTDWYMHRELQVRRNGTSYYSYTPVWYDHTVYGMNKWDKGVYRVGGGKNGGKWIAIDPYNNNFKTFKTRAAAEKAYNGFIKQRNDDVVGGVVRTVTDTVDSALTINFFRDKPLFGSIGDSLLNRAGISPDESSNVFRTTNRTANATFALASIFGGEVANVRPALSFLRGGATVESESAIIPSVIYRQGKGNPGNLTARAKDDGLLSFRDSLSNPYPLPEGQAPVMNPGQPYIGVSTKGIPPENFVFDDIPGHVMVKDVPPEVLKNNIIEKGKFPQN